MVFHLIRGDVSDVSTLGSETLDSMRDTDVLCERNTFLTVVNAAQERTRRSIIRRANSESDINSSHGSSSCCSWRVAIVEKNSRPTRGRQAPERGQAERPCIAADPQRINSAIRRAIPSALTQWERPPVQPFKEPTTSINPAPLVSLSSGTPTPTRAMSTAVGSTFGSDGPAGFCQLEKPRPARETGDVLDDDARESATADERRTGNNSRKRISRPCRALRRKCQELADAIDLTTAAAISRECAESNPYLSMLLAAKIRMSNSRTPGLQGEAGALQRQGAVAAVPESPWPTHGLERDVPCRSESSRLKLSL